MRIYFSLILLLLFPAIILAEELPQQAEQVVDYHISAKLDTVSKQVNGQIRLIWRNPSDDSVPDLWFHLYLNAFKNNRSTFFKESGGQLRNDKMVEGRWGWVDITSMHLADGTDLARGASPGKRPKSKESPAGAKENSKSGASRIEGARLPFRI